MALDSGTYLGSYEILGLLGSGGMGEIYRAKDPKLGREVAIKMLRPGLAGGSGAAEDRLTGSCRTGVFGRRRAPNGPL